MDGHFAETRRPGAGPGGQVAQSGQRTQVLVAPPGFHAQAARMRVRHLRIDQRPAPIAQPPRKRRQRIARFALLMGCIFTALALVHHPIASVALLLLMSAMSGSGYAGLL